MLTGNESQRITDYIEIILTSLVKRGDGNYTIRTFYKNGQPHSTHDNPAEIHRVSGGRVVVRKWFKMGVEHREGDKPALIQYTRKYLKSKMYFKNGNLHRDGDKPANIVYMAENIPQIQEWYQDGLLHREGDKPCSITRDVFLGGEAAEITYCKTGLLHRDGDKPAVIVLDTSGNISLEIYYKKDMLHRDGDRPAKISYKKDGSVDRFAFALNGKEYTPDDPAWRDEYRGKYEKIN